MKEDAALALFVNFGKYLQFFLYKLVRKGRCVQKIQNRERRLVSRVEGLLRHVW